MPLALHVQLEVIHLPLVQLAVAHVLLVQLVRILQVLVLQAPCPVFLVLLEHTL